MATTTLSNVQAPASPCPIAAGVSQSTANRVLVPVVPDWALALVDQLVQGPELGRRLPPAYRQLADTPGVLAHNLRRGIRQTLARVSAEPTLLAVCLHQGQLHLLLPVCLDDAAQATDPWTPHVAVVLHPASEFPPAAVAATPQAAGTPGTGFAVRALLPLDAARRLYQNQVPSWLVAPAGPAATLGTSVVAVTDPRVPLAEPSAQHTEPVSSEGNASRADQQRRLRQRLHDSIRSLCLYFRELESFALQTPGAMPKVRALVDATVVRRISAAQLFEGIRRVLGSTAPGDMVTRVQRRLDEIAATGALPLLAPYLDTVRSVVPLRAPAALGNAKPRARPTL